jgi:hypothetical protein
MQIISIGFFGEFLALAILAVAFLIVSPVVLLRFLVSFIHSRLHKPHAFYPAYLRITNDETVQVYRCNGCITETTETPAVIHRTPSEEFWANQYRLPVVTMDGTVIDHGNAGFRHRNNPLDLEQT